MIIFIYINDALQNIYENKKQILSFVIFLTLSFIGITITDSLIFSVSKKAEEELKTYGDNVISINIYNKKNINDLMPELSSVYKKISYSKTYIFNGGQTPYADESLSVTGIDTLGLSINKINIGNVLFEGNVAIVSEDSPYLHNGIVFLNGISFKIISIIPKIKTDFLDSLGLSKYQSNNQIFIPLNTLFRFTLTNNIDKVNVVLNNKVDGNDIDVVRKLLYIKEISDYNIITVLDARVAVDKVLNRFSLLTNTIYIMLTSSAAVICIVLCKRTFSSRSTEFALKIIHGIRQNSIILVVVIESIITLVICLFISLVASYFIMSWMSHMLSTEIKIRSVMIAISLSGVLIIFLFSNMLLGRLFFRINPIYLIKGRQQ
ncbi:FtsX-like permease family protein [Escherichia coli]|uniref:FtsX-like permease family protein n=1 Tax=Escherichia coli TaxID=562 RepID=UPI000C7A2D31|nr:FtsX-like permease family protein [Escherichia coli]AUM10837.1 permease [Escherichia coli]MBZ8327405.1 FtsX-like permease family protein [Escherichia coli]